jgi:HEPN domain-containing protein
VSHDLGESDYRIGGNERLKESKLLLGKELFAGAVYLAGRAVESVLRAVIWRYDSEIKVGAKSLETGHDLRQLLQEVIDLGVLRNSEDRDELFDNVQYVARLWFNNMRFIPAKKLKNLWWRQGEIDSKRDLKRACLEFYNGCALIVRACEKLCQK